MKYAIARSALVFLALIMNQSAAFAGSARAEMLHGSAFRIIFDTPMQAMGNEITEGTIRLDPQAAITCSWASDTQIQCIASQNLLPATAYAVHVAALRSLDSEQPWPAMTLRLETERPVVGASAQGWENGLPRIDVVAALETEAGSLADHLELRFEGKPLAFSLSARKANRWKHDTSARYDLQLKRPPGRNGLLTLGMRPGLRSPLGPLPGKQDGVIARFALRPQSVLEGLVCGPDHARVSVAYRERHLDAECPPYEPVRLIFSAELDAATRDGLLERFRLAAGAAFESPMLPERRASSGTVNNPFLPPRTEAPAAYWIELGALAPHQSVTTRIDRKLVAARGFRLGTMQLQVRSGAAIAQLSARHSGAVLDRHAMPKSLLTVQGEQPVSIRFEGVSDQARDETIELHPDGDRQTASAAWQVAMQTLDQGGWVRATPQGPGHAVPAYGRRDSLELFAPDFDLYAVSGRREVLVWANAWDGSGVIAGAKVELLMRDGDGDRFEPVAEGSTAADGTALIRLPESLRIRQPHGEDAWDWTGPEWAIRAEEPNEGLVARSILPLGHSHYRSPIGLDRPVRAWGISDRNMYRAGDEVRFQIWRRQFIGATMQQVATADPVTMQLMQDDSEKVILTWEEPASPNGTIASSRRLPAHLADGTYCIGIASGETTEGACFFVGSFNPQDLWVELRAEPIVLGDGDAWSAEIAAGYFSGGSAANVELSLTGASLYAMALEEAYPEFSGFTFVDVYADDVTAPDLVEPDMAERLGSDGHATIRGRVEFDAKGTTSDKRAAFGYLALGVEVSPEDREGTYAENERLRYARFDRYVGLRTTPNWFDAESEVRVEAVVIDRSGRAIEDQHVEVQVEYLGDAYLAEGESGVAPLRVGQCALLTGAMETCRFQRQRTGRYRLVASSGDAAAATIERYVWVQGQASRLAAGSGIESEFELLRDSSEPGQAVLFRLAQKRDAGSALILISRGDEILEHHTIEFDQPVQQVALTIGVQRDVRHEIRVFIRDAKPVDAQAGLRRPPDVETIWSYLPAGTTAERQSSLHVAFESEAAAPGNEVVLVLVNESSEPREVAVTVTDDALRAQAQRWLPYADPAGPLWLGGIWERGGWLETAGFSGQYENTWTWLVDAPAAAPAQPAASGMRFQMEAPAPATVEDYDEEGSRLERIEVTGSRIRRADIVEEVSITAPDTPTGDEWRQGPPQQGLDVRPSALRLRTRFEDTAFWLSGQFLQPGEKRRVRIRLPHNLTRWRAIAWSADSGKGFEMADATIEAGLPLELRVQTPARLYPGDAVDVAANVRQSETAPIEAKLALTAFGAGIETAVRQTVALEPGGQGSVRIHLAPDQPGDVVVQASARAPIGGDAVGGRIDVASRQIRTRLLQAGWLAGATRSVDLPPAPSGASNREVEISLIRPERILTRRWVEGLRDYPHRCWEQILSRAVGAAVALQDSRSEWPKAAEDVQEALDNAAVFQNQEGEFSFFADSGFTEDAGSRIALTAYSVRALEWLKTQGHPVPRHVLSAATKHLLDHIHSGSEHAAGASPKPDLASVAFAASVVRETSSEVMELLWQSWSSAPLPVQIAIARAMALSGHPQTGEALERILATVPARAGVRRLQSTTGYAQWLSSDLREHCALLGLLREHPGLVSASMQDELQRGLIDLYSEAAEGIDTQAAAECLISVGSTSSGVSNAVAVIMSIGERSEQLQLDPDADKVAWKVPAETASALQIAPASPTGAVAFLTELSYTEDMRSAKAKAIGLALRRHYDVWVNGDWKPAADHVISEGDWIRITMEVSNAAPRHHVALTDEVPGGIRPTDLSLSGVAGLDLRRVSQEGSPYFGTRRLDPKSPKFYAEQLPPGTHKVHYFARVAHSGHFLAPPALAELMYGSIGRARSDSAQLEFRSADDGSRDAESTSQLE